MKFGRREICEQMAKVDAVVAADPTRLAQYRATKCQNTSVDIVSTILCAVTSECVGYAPVVHGALPAPALVDLPDAQDATKMSAAELSAAQLHVPTSQCSCHRPPCHTSSIHDPHADTCWHHVEGARMWARSHSDGLYHRDAPDIELQENLISLSVTNPLPGSFNCLRPCEPDEPEMGPSDDWLEIDTRPALTPLLGS